MPELWLKKIFPKTVFVSTDLPERRIHVTTVNRNRMVGLAGKLQRRRQIMLGIKGKKSRVTGKRYAAYVFI